MHVSLLDETTRSQGTKEACTGKTSSATLKVSGKAHSDSCYTSSMYTQADIQSNLHPNGQQDPVGHFLEKEALPCTAEVHSELYKDREYVFGLLSCFLGFGECSGRDRESCKTGQIWCQLRTSRCWPRWHCWCWHVGRRSGYRGQYCSASCSAQACEVWEHLPNSCICNPSSTAVRKHLRIINGQCVE